MFLLALLLPAIAGLLLSGASASAQEGPPASTCPGWFEELGKEWIDQAPDAPGLQLAVLAPRCKIDCKKTWASPFDNYTAFPAMVSNTPYRVGSTTKSFTAITIMKLFQDGILDLNKPIKKYLPDWAGAFLDVQQGVRFANGVTAWQLLHHTSGLPNHLENAATVAFAREFPDHQFTQQEFLEWAGKNIPAGGPPGGKYMYSDLGYTYLGVAIEKMTGLPLGKAVRKAANWDRLGMRSTYWEQYEQHPSYLPPQGRLYMGSTDTSNLAPTPYGGAGVVTTAEDMVKFASAFHTGQLLEEEAMNLTYTKIPENEGGLWYGCGWTWTKVAGREAWYHKGAWTAWMFYIPSLDLTVGGTFNQFNQRPSVAPLIEDVVKQALKYGCN